MAPSRYALLTVFLFVLAPAASGQVVVPSEWNAASGAWNVPGNWFPNDVPDNGAGFVYNVQIGNRPVAAGAAVTLIPEDGTSDTIETLVISGAADLFTNGHQLVVNGLTTVTAGGSTIRVDPHAVPGTAALQAGDLDLAAGGALAMNGGRADVTADLDVAGVLSGHGTLNVGDGDAVAEQAFQNSGQIQVNGSLDTVGVLTIHTVGVDTIDLDGDNELGVVDVSNVHADLEADTLTLIVDGPLTDGFGSSLGSQLLVGQRDTLTFNDSLEIDAGAAIVLDGGAAVATINGPGVFTDVAGATFTVTGDGVIQNSMTFSGTANVVTINANSSLTLGGTVSIPDASALSMTSSSELIIAGATTVNEVAGAFNWDGTGTSTTTVQGAGLLTLTVGTVDSGDDVYGGTINLNDGGDLFVDNVANAWTLAGTMNKNNAGTSIVNGDRMLVIGNVVANAGTLDLPAVTLSPGADVAVTGTLSLGGGSEFAGPSAINGAGMLRMEGSSTVSANTTVAVGTFDWDGAAVGGTHVINNGVALTISSPALDTDGDMDDVVSLGGNGAQLVVSGPASWTQTNVFNANTAVAGTATIGGTSRAVFQNTLNVDGNTTADARVTLAGTTAIDALMTLRLNGGTSLDVNNIAGGTVNGPGTLAANTGKVLSGFGTINSIVDFDGDADIVAAGGMLDLNGNINDVGTLRTSGVAAVLDLPNGFSTNVTDDGILLEGGSVTGGCAGRRGREQVDPRRRHGLRYAR